MEKSYEQSDANAARKQLRKIADELEAIRFRLLGVHASLAATSREVRLLAGGGPEEGAAEMLTAIECILIDRISPGLRALREAAEAGPEGPAPETP